MTRLGKRALARKNWKAAMTGAMNMPIGRGMTNRDLLRENVANLKRLIARVTKGA
jgi:hypothetical protein